MTAMFKNNSIQSIFRFLDEESSIIEDLRMLASFHQTLPESPGGLGWRQRAVLTGFRPS
jgi:hypothetical protein